MESVIEKFSIFDYNVNKRQRIRRSGIFFFILVVLIWLTIFVLIIENGKHLSQIESSRSTSGFTLKESVITNFTSDEFNTNYVKPNEFKYYNRVWDRSDISFAFPNEIQVITNVVITPNQTQSVCPESPTFIGILCDPKNPNACKPGVIRPGGVQTGVCRSCDMKYFNSTTDKWEEGNCCEIDGWCPSVRHLPPLNGDTAILKDTKNSILWLRNTIGFNSLDIVIDNSDYINCIYHPIHKPLCPFFVLNDIVNYAQNNYQSYDEMAIYGAEIEIKIQWNCFLPIFRSFYQNRDCYRNYSFIRTDIDLKWTWNFPENKFYNQIFLCDEGQTRTVWRSYRLRLTVNASAIMNRYDFFQFMANLFAYYAIYSISLTLFALYIRKRFKISDEMVPIQLFHQSSENSETIPLIPRNPSISENS